MEDPAGSGRRPLFWEGSSKRDFVQFPTAVQKDTTAAQGQFAGESYSISSRDEIEKLDYAGRRVALSMPEYVAGLQFEHVIILDANEGDLPRGGYSGFQFRRFVSELYLGVSRAEKSLTIFATQDRGGLLQILGSAAAQGLIVPFRP
jgi:hypothetical protein